MMINIRRNLRNVVAVVAISFAGSATMFAQEETGVQINPQSSTYPSNTLI